MRRLHSVDAPSAVPSLECWRPAARIPLVPQPTFFLRDVNDVHRFEEVINGREYLIEVSSVGRGKWRAQIQRTPGACGALMPFYGTTPDEAAQHLSRWLALVHGQERPRV